MIGTPRPEAYRKLKQFPIFENKWLILTIFVILLLVIFVISSKFTNAGTGLEITPIGNKFRLNFQIPIGVISKPGPAFVNLEEITKITKRRITNIVKINHLFSNIGNCFNLR